MADLILPPDCLLVCVDDTGHERLAGDHVFYGLGGCAFLMRDYKRVVGGPWRAVRRFVTGSEETPLHASDFGCNATPDQASGGGELLQNTTVHADWRSWDAFYNLAEPRSAHFQQSQADAHRAPVAEDAHRRGRAVLTIS